MQFARGDGILRNSKKRQQAHNARKEQTVDQQQEKAREKAEDDRYQRAEQQQAAYDDEYESRRETLSALALFQQDSVEQLAGGSRQNRRDYYQKLLSRLYIELISWMHS